MFARRLRWRHESEWAHNIHCPLLDVNWSYLGKLAHVQLPIFLCTNVYPGRSTRSLIYMHHLLDDVMSQNELTTQLLWSSLKYRFGSCNNIICFFQNNYLAHLLSCVDAIVTVSGSDCRIVASHLFKIGISILASAPEQKLKEEAKGKSLYWLYMLTLESRCIPVMGLGVLIIIK